VSLLSVALKEWDLVISHLLTGRQAILLRKGGILEAENEFELEHNRFLLWPTYVHQDPRMVRAQFRSQIVAHPTEPSRVSIRGYADVAKIIEVPRDRARARIDSLSDLHLWDEPLIDMRFAYRPERPLYIVVLRAFVLPAPVAIDNTVEYAGCKSWITLNEKIDITASRPALPEEHLQTILARVQQTLADP
jgi:hypothetical protein